MTDSSPDTSLLSAEQLAALTDAQKQIFTRLDPPDQQFFAQNFSPASLGKALERKWETLQSRSRLAAHDKQVQQNFQAQGFAPAANSSLTAGDIAVGAAGVAGLIGIGVLAKQIAPEGKASWRGVTPRDLVDPLIKAFARQQKTDIRFDPPDAQGNLYAAVLVRTSGGSVPALNITLTPLDQSTQVQISKISSESLLQTVKDGSDKLIHMVQDGLHLNKHQAGVEDWLGMAGEVVNGGADLAKTVQDLDLEDRAWQAIQAAAEPLQTVYDEKMAGEKERLSRLEMAWDDYANCPKCRVAFGAEDAGCRVCGTARPPKPEQPDPRGSQSS
jgi:hypothetical protein